jgi:signal transduction histidine kinase
MGLSNMKYRAAAIGGSLTVKSHPGAGTRICCDFPLRAPGAAPLTSVVAVGRLKA